MLAKTNLTYFGYKYLKGLPFKVKDTSSKYGDKVDHFDQSGMFISEI